MTAAERDPLTGILGRHGFLRALASADADGTEGAVLVVDLDDFHLVNTLLGIDRGDDVLRLMAGRLGRLAGRAGVASRLGSDQFALWMPVDDLTRAAGRPNWAAATHGFAERILDAVCQPFSVDGDDGRTTACIGYALSATGSAIDALHAATAAVANAKTQGLASILAHDDARLAANLRRYTIQAGLTAAVTNRELRVHFQPEIDLRTGATVGLEALARWEHPELGMVSPTEFIQVAEASGLIAPIGEYVLDVVAEEATRWTSALDGRPLTLWFNLSAVQLTDPERLVDTVRSAVDRYRLPAGALGAEVTETAVMADITEARTTLQRLRDLGLEIAVDDFGAGHASWPYLWQIPATVLKIDRTFASELLAIPEGLAMTEAVIDLAHTFRLRVVAEGVETADQASMLARLGADRAQGHLFSPDVPASEIHAVTSQPWAGGAPSPHVEVRARVASGFHGRHAAVLVDALDASNDAVVLVDRLPTMVRTADTAVPSVQFANRAFERLVGVDLDELRGRALLDVLPSLGDVGTALVLDDASERGAAVTVEVEHRRPTGQLSWIEISFGPRHGLDLTGGAADRDEAGETVIGWIAIARDVTRRYTLEREVEQRARLDELAMMLANDLLDGNAFAEPMDTDAVEGDAVDVDAAAGAAHAAAMARIGEVYAADVVTIVTIDEDGPTAVSWHRAGTVAGGAPPPHAFDVDDNQLAAVIAGETVIITDIRHPSSQEPQLAHGSATSGWPIRSVLAVPMPGASRVRGALAVGRLAPRGWTASETASLRSVAETMARADAREEQLDALRRAATIAQLRRFVSTRALGVDVDGFLDDLDIVCEKLADAIGMASVQIDVIDAGSGELRTVAASIAAHISDRMLSRFSVPLTRVPATSAALHARQPIVVEQRSAPSGGWLVERAQVRQEDPMEAGVLAPLMSGGSPLGAIVLFHDVAKHFRPAQIEAIAQVAETLSSCLARLFAERDLREAEERFRLIAEHGSDVITLASASGEVEFVSGALVDLLGWSPEEHRRRGVTDFVHPDDRPGVEVELRAAVRHRRVARMLCRLRHRDGGYVWTETVAQPTFQADGSLRGWVATTRDMTERHSIEAELTHLALHDQLTGAANRVLLADRLDLANERLARQGSPYSVAVMDVDHFKSVNDDHGQAAGDEVLKVVALRAASVLRTSDLLARLGGDEFAVVCASDLAGSKAMMERLVARLGEPVWFDGRAIEVRLSVGLVAGDPGVDGDELLSRADRAMYEAKRAGGGQVRVR
jgi:diguanylate cyclase (GGDEF)-like protein/PAS domain S-box-containing protein